MEKLDEKSQCQNNEYYIPHKAIVRKTAQTTKVRVIPQQKVVLKMCHWMSVLNPGLRYKT